MAHNPSCIITLSRQWCIADSAPDNPRTVRHAAMGSTVGKNTSFTKPEVQNISQRHGRRTDPRPQVACTENVMKTGRIVPEIFSLTGAHRQTHRQTCSLQYSSAQSEVTNQHKGGNSETIEGRRIWQLNDFNLTTPLK